MMILRFVGSELSTIPRLVRMGYSHAWMVLRGRSLSPQSKQGIEQLKKLAKEGKVCTLRPFSSQNWRLFKEYHQN